MFYSSKNSFDIMFVILCVIAGATSHSISNNNSKKLPVHAMPNPYRASLIDFILDTDVINNLQSSNFINERWAKSIDQQQTELKLPAVVEEENYTKNESGDVCVLLSSILNTNQIKFCQRHQDILEIVLPNLINLTKIECARITKNLRWNCSDIEPYLDRSKSISLTKEAALIRSILNASMMYLTIKVCNDHNHHSCGCQANQVYREMQSSAPEADHNNLRGSTTLINESDISNSSLDNLTLSPVDLWKLHNGGPLRLSRSGTRRQGCLANVAFANAFTKTFLDLDDTKSLNKAYRVLNDENKSNKRRPVAKHLGDPDYKDLSTIKWTKSAINLHNNHVGRQVVRELTHRQCRCHGVSGVCQFQTCWDRLPNFNAISDRLLSMYLNNITQVESINLGMFDKPDLYLAPIRPPALEEIPSTMDDKSQNHRFEQKSINIIDSDNTRPNADGIRSNELIFLHNSPDYCESLPIVNHEGTRGRPCIPINNNVTKSKTETSKKNDTITRSTVDEFPELNHEDTSGGTYGTCEELCCNRGYRSELALDMVACNCRFKFCCRVECEYCLHQRKLHFCL